MHNRLPEKTGGRRGGVVSMAMRSKKMELAMQLYGSGLATLRMPVVVLLSEAPDYIMAMGRICDEVGIGVASLSESSKTWERDGIISRLTPVNDLRAVGIRLTAAGLEAARLLNTPPS